MAVIDLNTTEWHNADGLLVKFGPGEAQVTRGGQHGTLASGQHVVEVSLDLLALSTVAPFSGTDEVIIADNVTIPAGAFIERIETVTTEATTFGASATLDLGLVDQNRTTEIDFDGLLTNAVLPLAIGTVNIYTKAGAPAGAAGVGPLVGTVLTNTGLLTASCDVANFTAGVIKIRVLYSVPTATELA